MVSRMIGAVARAFLMVILIATPSILVPGVSQESGQIVTIVALFAAALTIFEYASTYPGLVEFRDAPPFNRIRFAALFATVFCLSVIVRGQTDYSTATQFMTAIGMLIGQAIDFPYSPVRFVVSMLACECVIQRYRLAARRRRDELSDLSVVYGSFLDGSPVYGVAGQINGRIQCLGKPSDIRPHNWWRRCPQIGPRRPL